MMNSLRLKEVLAVTLAALAFTALACTGARAESVDPQATEILKRMTAYLGSLQQFSVHTQNTLNDVEMEGHLVDIDVSANVIISRPNKLRAERKGDLVDQVFFYNGKTLTLFNPAAKVYATEPAPGSFQELFQHMYATLGIGVPISDLIYPDPYPLLMQDVQVAAMMGKTYINGVKCDHLFFSRPGVDFQVWVMEGSKPLPCKYVVTDTTTAARLSITTFMSDWNVAPGVDDNQFTFEPPKGVQSVGFVLF